MIAIGVGANSRAQRDDIIAAFIDLSRETKGARIVATLQGASFANLVEEVANTQSLTYRTYSREALRERNGDCMTHSPRTLDLFGVASVAECSALAAAGMGSRLLMPRRIIGNITIAAAASADAKEVL